MLEWGLSWEKKKKDMGAHPIVRDVDYMERKEQEAF